MFDETETKQIEEISRRVYAQKGTKYGVPDVPNHTHNNIDSPSVSVANISSYLPYVTAVPTLDPTGNFALSLALHTDTDQIDYFDLTNKAWRSVGGTAAATAFGGKVNAGGTGTLPTGWTSSVDGGNQYTITHSLGTANYGFSFALNTRSLVPVYITVGANDLLVEFQNSVGTAFATEFYFTLNLIV